MSTERFIPPLGKMFAKKSSGTKSFTKPQSSSGPSQAASVVSAVGKATSGKILIVVGIIATLLTIILVPIGLSYTFRGNFGSGISTLVAGLLAGWLAYTMFSKM